MSAYSAYSARAFYIAEKDDLRTVALAIAGDPQIATGGCTGVLDAGKLARAASQPCSLERYGPPGSGVAVTISAGDETWKLGAVGRGRSACYSLQVSVALNDARCVPGVLAITVWEDGA
jgi:hypothetical protein